MGRQALGEDGALGEGAQEWVEGLHSFDRLRDRAECEGIVEGVATIGQFRKMQNHATGSSPRPEMPNLQGISARSSRTRRGELGSGFAVRVVVGCYSIIGD